MVQVAAAQDPESVPNVCGGIAANTPTNVGVSFLGRKKRVGEPEQQRDGEHEPHQRPSPPQPQRH